MQNVTKSTSNTRKRVIKETGTKKEGSILRNGRLVEFSKVHNIQRKDKTGVSQGNPRVT